MKENINPEVSATKRILTSLVFYENSETVHTALESENLTDRSFIEMFFFRKITTFKVW